MDSLEDGIAVLAVADLDAMPALEVAIAESAPPWLGELVGAAHRAGATVTVVATRNDGPAAEEAIAGWEIGICQAALLADVDEIDGIDPQRVRRVRTVLAALATGSAPSVPTEASRAQPAEVPS